MLNYRTPLFLLVVMVACRPNTPRSSAGGPTVPGPPTAADTAGALVVREPTVVVFWLRASDTLNRTEGPGLLDDFRHYTAEASDWFDDEGIPLLATNSDSIIVESKASTRRVITLSGLDYPFGYVLINPGYAEEILTGLMTDEDLLDEAATYFGTDEEDGNDTARVVRRADPSARTQDFAHLDDQRGRGERLLQKGGIGQQLPVLSDRLLAVP
jgi:hypothetical protein